MTRASTCQPGGGKKDLNRLPYLAEPLLRFDLNHELELLRREESWGRETGRSSKTLAKYPDFRIVLVSMKAGSHMNDHKAEARISIQALEGKMVLHVPDQNPIELSAGQLMTLDCGVHHDVEALAESAFLLTIAWSKGESRPAAEPAEHSRSAKHDRKHGIESHESKPHIAQVDDRSAARDYSDPSLEKFASEHELPPRWLELRKACDRLVARSDFWYRPELIDQARQLAGEASDILQTVLRQGKHAVREEPRTGEALATPRLDSCVAVGEHYCSA
jgi:quercetin dioxygenase-like cupin family protein